MRETKFRVWDKSRNEMFFIDDIFCIKESKWLENMRLGYGELMQFTGLTDRNRVKIYEGDLLRIGVQTYPVIWDSKNAQFILDTPHFHLGSQSIFYEVVGNIYESDLSTSK